MSEQNTQLAISETMQAALDKRKIDEGIWSALRSSIFPGATDESILLAVDYCKARKLDVLKKPCHIVPMNVKDAKSGKYAWRDVIMPGIAESRITANRTGQYGGQDAPVFGPNVEMQFDATKHTVPEYCTVTVYRIMGDGERVPFSNTEYFEEACATTKAGDLNAMWSRRKRGQLSKCAEAGALRKAFPEETGGMATAEEFIDVEANEVNRSQSGEKRKLLREKPLDPFNQPAATKPQEQTKQEETKEPEPPADDRQRGMLSDVEVKEGETKGKPWKAWVCEIFADGSSIKTGTFSATLGQQAIALIGQEVLFRLEQKGKQTQLTNIEAVEGGLV